MDVLVQLNKCFCLVTKLFIGVKTYNEKRFISHDFEKLCTFIRNPRRKYVKFYYRLKPASPHCLQQKR